MKKAKLMKEAKERALREGVSQNQRKAEEAGLAYKEDEIPPGNFVNINVYSERIF